MDDRHSNWQNNSLNIPHIPAIDENIEAIIHGKERRSPFSGPRGFLISHVPEPARKQDSRYIQKTLPFPKIPDYQKPSCNRITDALYKSILTSQFYAAMHYDHSLKRVDRLEQQFAKSTRDEDKLSLARLALDTLHQPHTFFMDAQRFIDRNRPYYDKFMPEVRDALSKIDPKVHLYHLKYHDARRALNAKADERTRRNA